MSSTIISVRGFNPTFGDNCFIAQNATIVGDVVMGDNCSVWFNTILRGDVNSIIIGNETNIQDGVIIHCTYQKTITEIGNNVSIAHGAIIHGCKIKDNVLVGMGAIIMDDAIINSGAVIAAGAVVLPKTVVPSNTVFAGIPAKHVKSTSSGLEDVINRTSKNYIMYASWYQK